MERDRIAFFGQVLDDHRLSIQAKDVAEDVHDLLQCGVHTHGVEDEGHGVLCPLGGDSQPVEGLSHGSVISLGAHLRQPSTLPFVSLGINLQQRHAQGLIGSELVDADDDAPPLVNLALVAVGSVGNLLLEKPDLDGWNDPTQRLDPLKVVVGLTLHAIGERLDGVCPTERIDGVGDARFVGDDLLGAECDGDGVLAREGQRLIQAVGMQGLGAPQYRSQ